MSPAFVTRKKNSIRQLTNGILYFEIQQNELSA